MYTLTGKYNSATIYADSLEESATEQIQAFVDSPASAGIGDGPAPQIAIMPDCHAGKGCVIGFTEKLTSEAVVPSLVGCDIGCGMFAVKVHDFDFDKRNLGKLDSVCHTEVASGFGLQKDIHSFAKLIKDSLERIHAPIDVQKALHSVGSLGSGNHFIELNQSEDGDYWFVVHTGSRHLGLEIESYYTALAKEHADDPDARFILLKGDDFKHYMHDMHIAQEFASINRQAIVRIVSDAFKWSAKNLTHFIETIHNYIDIDGMVVRKGAISLDEGEEAIIPMNMADGSLIVRGKGNIAWNKSGPHGAGRLMSRGAARRALSMEDFKASMAGIYSTTVCEDTIDESKMAYKPMESIVSAIKDTCDIVEIIKPIYNFKAAEKRGHKSKKEKSHDETNPVS